MLDSVSELVTRVVGASLRVEPDQLLTELGLDSLMAVELRNLLARSLGVPLPATLLFDHPSLEALARFLGQRLNLLEAAPLPARPDRPTPPIAARADRCDDDLADLSDEEAQAQLLAELQAGRGEPLRDTARVLGRILDGQDT